jgi:hypothetical protein
VKTTLRDALGSVIPGLFLITLTACGGGGNGQSAMAVSPPPVQPPAQTPESGVAWQGRYVGSVTIGDVQYFGDAMLTADGLIRLYVGAHYDNDGAVPEAVPATSAQLVGTLQGQASQISGDGLVFGQECAASDPIQYCAEIGNATISMAVVSGGTPSVIQGNIIVTTSTGAEAWTLNLYSFSNYYVDLPAAQVSLEGQYQEELADFALNGDTIINIGASGALNFQSPSSGCIGNGEVRPHLDGAVNVFDVSLTISGCDDQHSYLNSTYSGLATSSPSDEWDYDSNLRMWLSQVNPSVSASSPPALTTWASWQ